MTQVEELLIDWFSGRNAHGVQFDCDEDDLNLFIAYMKALPAVKAATDALAQLLRSPYLRSPKEPRLVTNCLPKIHFRKLMPPYQEAHDRIVTEYNLQEFIMGRDFQEDVQLNSNGVNPIYMCFIRFGDVYLVNLLPAP